MPVIVCDLDDTLFPEVQYAQSGFYAVGCWFLECHKNSLLDIDAPLPSADEFSSSCMHLHLSGVRGTIFDELLHTLRADGNQIHQHMSNQELVKEMVNVYRYHRPSISLHDDAVGLIKRYSSKIEPKNCLGIITNGLAQVQRLKVEALGIQAWFDHIVFCEDLGVQKPSDLPYKHMMELCGSHYQASEFLYVGDHAIKDFVGARQCGWKTARIIRENGLHGHVVAPEGVDADTVITSLDSI